jgi:hypothetical protein
MTGNFGNWDGTITDIGPIYPFVGWEALMVLVLIVFWVGWHIVQIRKEHQEHEEQARALRQGDNLHRAVMAEHTIERM